MSDAAIRQCTAADLEAVARIERGVADEDIIHAFAPSRDPGERLGGLFFVAEAEGQVVGFACGAVKVNGDLAVLPEGEYLEVEDVHVAAKYRNQGVGGELLERVLEAAREKGVERARLYSAARDLDSVVRFYRKHGFKTWCVQMYR